MTEEEPHSYLRYLPKVAALALIYFFAASGGLNLNAVSGFAAAVWPPTGISLFALYTFGLALWPGVFLGAFIVNYAAGAPFIGAVGMASGNSLEAVCAVYLLRRFAKFDPSLARLRDVVWLLFLAGLFSTLLSATVGVCSGFFTGVIPAERVFLAWGTWWIGDMISNLVIAPVLFTVTFTPQRFYRSFPRLESIWLALSVVFITTVVFIFPGDGLIRFRPYLMFPLVMWAALRFGPRESALTTFFISMVSITSVALGNEPFTRHSIGEGLVAVQAFIGVLALTGLICAALMSERKRSEAALMSSETALKLLLAEKEILLREVHHRVKNNLQVIVSLIRLQSAAAKDAAVHSLYRDTERRVRSMALIHDQLHKSTDVAEIHMGDYIRSLQQEMASAYEGIPAVISLEFEEFDDISLNLERAIPCGLILQELISNCYKHAFPGNVEGRVMITMKRSDNESVRIKVSDNGVGIPADFDIVRAQSLGLRIVSILAKQLNAELKVLNACGTTIEMSFPISAQAPPQPSIASLAVGSAVSAA